MSLSSEEIRLLQLLEDGTLDGDVGDFRVYRRFRSVLCGRYILNGIPVFFQEGKLPKAVSSKDEDEGQVLREEVRYDTIEGKLEFLQKYGWLIENEEVRAYSARYKPKKEGGN